MIRMVWSSPRSHSCASSDNHVIICSIFINTMMILRNMMITAKVMITVIVIMVTDDIYGRMKVEKGRMFSRDSTLTRVRRKTHFVKLCPPHHHTSQLGWEANVVDSAKIFLKNETSLRLWESTHWWKDWCKHVFNIPTLLLAECWHLLATEIVESPVYHCQCCTPNGFLPPLSPTNLEF